MLDRKAFDGIFQQGVQTLGQSIKSREGSKNIPALAEDVQRQIAQRVFGTETHIRTYSQLFDICSALEDAVAQAVAQGRLPEQFLPAIRDTQAAIQPILLQIFENRRMDTVHALDADTAGDVREEGRIAMVLAAMIPELRLREHADRPFTGKDMRQYAGDHYATIQRLLKIISRSDSEDWGLVKDMLPPDLQSQFIIQSPSMEQEQLKQIVEAYWEWFQQFGMEAVVDYLISEGILQMGFQQAIKHLAPYLRKCSTVKGKPSAFRKVAPAILKREMAADVGGNRLREAAYFALLERGVDSMDARSKAALVPQVALELEQYRPDGDNGEDSVHDKIAQPVLDLYDRALTMPIPDRLEPKLTVRGQEHNFMSLRQRIACAECEPLGTKKLIVMPQGTGKTETMFAIKEHTGSQKLVVVTTKEMLGEFAGRLRRDMQVEEGREPCYKKDEEPTVGVIGSGIPKNKKREVILKALDQEVILVSYTMLWEEVDDKPIVEWITEMNTDSMGRQIDMLAIDECQMARKPGRKGRTFTTAVAKLRNEIPSLDNDGRAVEFSATPWPKGAEDVVSDLQFLDPKRYGDIRSVKQAVVKSDPLVVRNTLSKGVLNMDGKADWRKYVDELEYSMSPQQMRIYRTIVNSTDLSHSQKLILLPMACQNPALLSGLLPNPDMNELLNAPGSLFGRLTEELTKDFETEHSVFVVQDKQKQGIGTPHEKRDPSGEYTLIDRVAAEFPDVELMKIHSDVSSSAERKKIIAAAREAQEKQNRKVLVYVQGGTTTLIGQNLSFANRMHVLNGYPWNIDDLSQWVMRFPREGREAGVRVSVWQPEGNTIYRGISQLSNAKEWMTDRIHNGGIPTDFDLGEQGISVGEVVSAISGEKLTGKLRFGRNLLPFLMSERRRLSLLFHEMRGQSDVINAAFMDQFGEEIANLYVRNYFQTTSANNAKFTSGIIHELESTGEISGTRFADIACGPCALMASLGTLKNLGSEDAYEHRRRHFDNVDLNKNMIPQGEKLLRDLGMKDEVHTHIASMRNMKGVLPDSGTYDVVNCSLALDLLPVVKTTKKAAKESVLNEQLVQTILEFNRLLKCSDGEHGVLIITMNEGTCSKEELDRICDEALPLFGFEVLNQWTGTGEAIDGTKAFKNICITARKISESNPAEIEEKLDRASLVMTRQKKTGKSSGKDTSKPQAKEDQRSESGNTCNRFKIKGREINYRVDPTERRDEMKSFYAVQTQVYDLRDIHSQNKGTLSGLQPEVLEELSARGIIISQFQTTGAAVVSITVEGFSGYIDIFAEVWDRNGR